jgi:hypothetical protein
MPQYNDISSLYPLTKIDTKTILDVWNSYTITDEFKKNTIEYGTYLVEEGDTWSSVAGKIYDDRRLWWVIALYNDLEDPFKLYYEFGITNKITELKLLSPVHIRTLLSSINDSLNKIDYENVDI